MVFIFNISVGGKFLFLSSKNVIIFFVISSYMNAVAESSSIESGLPTSADSLICWIIGISPKKGILKSSAKFLAPSFPKI